MLRFKITRQQMQHVNVFGCLYIYILVSIPSRLIRAWSGGGMHEGFFHLTDKICVKNDNNSLLLSSAVP